MPCNFSHYPWILIFPSILTLSLSLLSASLPVVWCTVNLNRWSSTFPWVFISASSFETSFHHSSNSLTLFAFAPFLIYSMTDHWNQKKLSNLVLGRLVPFTKLWISDTIPWFHPQLLVILHPNKIWLSR